MVCWRDSERLVAISSCLIANSAERGNAKGGTEEAKIQDELGRTNGCRHPFFAGADFTGKVRPANAVAFYYLTISTLAVAQIRTQNE